MSANHSLPYRSPMAKLVRFFCASRDKWKTKCQAANRENKSLKHCLAKMKQSRDRWKAKAKRLATVPGANLPPPQEDASPSRDEECKKHAPCGPRGH